eukprot:6340078-Prymnesium_polylepis.1
MGAAALQVSAHPPHRLPPLPPCARAARSRFFARRFGRVASALTLARSRQDTLGSAPAVGAAAAHFTGVMGARASQVSNHPLAPSATAAALRARRARVFCAALGVLPRAR